MRRQKHKLMGVYATPYNCFSALLLPNKAFFSKFALHIIIYKDMEDRKRTKLLFVCLGNICRSPAAEGVMKQVLLNRGMSDLFEVDSAGIGGWHVGELPDSRMRKCGAARGYNFNSRARQFDTDDFKRFDYIFVMDNDNKKMLSQKTNNACELAKVKMLVDYAASHPKAKLIPDPYYGDEKDFDYALDLIEDATNTLADRLAKGGEL